MRYWDVVLVSVGGHRHDMTVTGRNRLEAMQAVQRFFPGCRVLSITLLA